MSAVSVVFGSELELALARSACRRLLASTAIHLLASQRAAVEEVLAGLEPLGKAAGRWRIVLPSYGLQALHLAISRQVDHLRPHSEPEFNAAQRIMARIDVDSPWILADPHVIADVAALFAPDEAGPGLTGGPDVVMPSAITFQACLADGIGVVGRFDGPAAAPELARLWPLADTVVVGHRGRPLLRFSLSQRSSAGLLEPAAVVQQRMLRIVEVGKDYGALVLVRTLAQVDPDSLLHGADVRPAQVLLMWVLA